LRQLDPQSLRDYLKMAFGGRYEREDEEIMKIWRAGVKKRAIVNEPVDTRRYNHLHSERKSRNL